MLDIPGPGLDPGGDGACLRHGHARGLHRIDLRESGRIGSLRLRCIRGVSAPPFPLHFSKKRRSDNTPLEDILLIGHGRRRRGRGPVPPRSGFRGVAPPDGWRLPWTEGPAPRRRSGAPRTGGSRLGSRALGVACLSAWLKSRRGAGKSPPESFPRSF